MAASTGAGGSGWALPKGKAGVGSRHSHLLHSPALRSPALCLHLPTLDTLLYVCVCFCVCVPWVYMEVGGLLAGIRSLLLSTCVPHVLIMESHTGLCLVLSLSVPVHGCVILQYVGCTHRVCIVSQRSLGFVDGEVLTFTWSLCGHTAKSRIVGPCNSSV